jgi:hypothetical protein
MEGTVSSSLFCAYFRWGHCWAFADTQHGHQDLNGRWVRLCSTISCIVGSAGALLVVGLRASSSSFLLTSPSSSASSFSTSSRGFTCGLMDSAELLDSLVESPFNAPAWEKASPSSQDSICCLPSEMASCRPSPGSQSRLLFGRK